MRSRLPSAVFSIAFFAAPAVGVLGQATTRVNVTSAGVQANLRSSHSTISSDGRFVAFFSTADNLVPGDTNRWGDIFVHDRESGETRRVSVHSDGTQGNERSENPSISADGRFVAFFGLSDTLVDGDVNERLDVFVHDLQTRETDIVSVNSAGELGDSLSMDPQLSADGSLVAFRSLSSNLVPDSNHSGYNIYVHDRTTGQTTCVSRRMDGLLSLDHCNSPALSGDGRFAAFGTRSAAHVPDDTNETSDIFVHDRSTGETTRVSVDSAGNEANDASLLVKLSHDGRYVAFNSFATNLVSGDTNQHSDIFVHDRVTGQTTRVSVATSGLQGDADCTAFAISADGRHVAFSSKATNLVPGDTDGRSDVFVHDRATGRTTRVSVNSVLEEVTGQSGGTPTISGDGRFVAFESTGSKFVDGDTNAAADIFVHDRRPCADGTVGSGAGPVADVLTINGESRIADVPRHASITVALAASLAGPDPADYALWLWLGYAAHQRDLVVAGEPLGCTVNPTPFDAANILPRPYKCLVGGLGAEYSTGVNVHPLSPASAPWTLTKATGFGHAIKLTIQGVIEDATAGNASGLSVTNAVLVRVD